MDYDSMQSQLTTEKKKRGSRKEKMNLRKDDDIELHRFKTEINLVEFALTQFGYLVDTKRSSPNSIVVRKESEKLIVTRDVDGHYVYFAPVPLFVNDCGSIIDFIQKRKSVPLGAVRVILRAYQGTSGAHLSPKTAGVVKTIQPVSKNTLAILKAYEAFSDLSSSVYLESRGIEKEIYTNRRFAQKIRLDRGHLIFPHFDKNGICGFERKNQNFTRFSAGGTKAIWSSNRYAKDERLVIAEAVIDALSYQYCPIWQF